MKLIYKISREDLKNKKYKKRETVKFGDLPSDRDREALAELLKAIKQMKNHSS